MKDFPDGQALESGVSDLKLKGFKVYEINEDVSNIPTYNRRDFTRFASIPAKAFCIMQIAE